MIYRSNLVAPHLTPYFKLHEFDHYGGHTFLGGPAKFAGLDLFGMVHQ